MTKSKEIKAWFIIYLVLIVGVVVELSYYAITTDVVRNLIEVL